MVCSIFFDSIVSATARNRSGWIVNVSAGFVDVPRAPEARLDAAALGLGMMAIIRLKTTHEHIKPALKAFAEMPHVIEVHRLTGEDCFLLKVLVPTPGQLETIVDTIARFGAVTTSLVLRSEPAKPLGKALLS